jgi:hypothetical protein
MKHILFATLVLLVLPFTVCAERPPQSKDDAKLVLTGTVKNVTLKTSPFGGDGVRTDYTANVVVDSVEKGMGAKVGDTVSVTWFHVTKRPSGTFAAAYGHGYALEAKDKAKFWLLESPKGGWEIIYNKDGAQKISR